MVDFESLQFERKVYLKLQSAEREEELTDKRYSSKEVLQAMQKARAKCCGLPGYVKTHSISGGISGDATGI